jgi:hypothetical protein
METPPPCRRNWRVHLASTVPARWSAGTVPRLMHVQLLTDFGDRVSEAGHEGPWDSEAQPVAFDTDVLSRVFVALSLEAAEDPRRAPPRGAAGVLRVWGDRAGTMPLDPTRLPVCADSTAKVWLSLDAGGMSASRDIDGAWLRLKGATVLAGGCPEQGDKACAEGSCFHHPGGGEVLPAW